MTSTPKTPSRGGCVWELVIRADAGQDSGQVDPGEQLSEACDRFEECDNIGQEDDGVMMVNPVWCQKSINNLLGPVM